MRGRGRLAASALVAVTACALACRPVAPDKGLQPSDVEVRYSVNVARPSLRFSLHLPPAADPLGARLLLATDLGAGGMDTLGYFRVPVAAPRRTAIGLWILQNDLLRGDRGEASTAEGSGSIEIRAGDRVATLGLAADDPAVDKLHAMLDPIVRDPERRPERAVHLEVTIHHEGAALRPEITLSTLGTAPVDLVVFEPGDAGMWARFGATISTPRGGAPQTTGLSRNDVASLVDAGKLPKGVTSVPPGTVYSCLLSNVEPPPAGQRATITATAMVWLAGTGPNRKERIPLELKTTAELAP